MTLLLVAMTPPALPPSRAIEEQTAVCDMTSPDRARTELNVHFRPEESNGRRGYWWTISGDDRLYPSNRTARNMYSYEDYLRDTSEVWFESGGYQYTYTLRYKVGSAGGESRFLPVGQMIVYRRLYNSWSETDVPVGIGFCDIRRVSQ